MAYELHLPPFLGLLCEVDVDRRLPVLVSAKVVTQLALSSWK